MATTSTPSPYASAVLANSPVGYYRLGDVGTTTAADSSGNGGNGMYVGLGTGLTQGTPGLIAGDPETSTTSNGSPAGYISVARNSAFESPTTVTIEAWVKLSSTAAYQSLVEYGDNSSTYFRGYGLKYSHASSAFEFRIAIPSGSYTIVKPRSGLGTNPSIGVIYHLVGTYDGAAAKLYVDGQLVASTALSGPITYDNPANNSGLVIFDNQGRNAPTFGAMQEVALYNSALSASAILTHYNIGAPKPEPNGPGYFIGVPAYSPVTNLLYVGDPNDLGNFSHGLIALKAQGACAGFTIGWKATVGSATTADGNQAPTVAGNVVYFGDGRGDQVFAFDAATGALLWNSGSTITGWVFAAPTVDGRLYIGSWDHKLYAFGL